MTTNERIAEFLEKEIKASTQAGIGDIVRGESGLFIADRKPDWRGLHHRTYEPWDPEHDIRCWHGEHGILAKIEEKGDDFMLRFLQAVLGEPVQQYPRVGSIWMVRRAEAPQLAAALVKVIEEEHANAAI
jgi:hypothetical protein